jgi:6-phosphogluconolactonase
MRLHELADGEAVAREAATRIAAADADSGERFAICLSGGSTPQTMYGMLASDEFASRMHWKRWHVFFGDERQVPLDDDRSNYANARRELLDRVPIPHGQIHPLTDADQYEGMLRSFFGARCDFDVLLLGMGDDGHTASLFPGSISLMEEERWVIEPPDVVGGMARYTLTLPALSAARRTFFLVSGAGKHDALRRVRAGEALPSGMVTDADWLVDRAAVGGT